MESLVCFILYGIWGAAIGVVVKLAIPGFKGLIAGILAILFATSLILLLASESMPLSSHALSLCALCAIALYVLLARKLLQSLRQQVDRSRQLRAWAVSRFSSLDVDGDGLITIEDLYNLKTRDFCGAYDSSMLRHLECHISDIGHGIDGFAAPSVMSGGTAMVVIYGINRDDLASYPDRITARYEQQRF